MKRFVIATASAFLLLAGSAGAAVPNGPTGSRVAHENASNFPADGGTGRGALATEGIPSAVPGVDPTAPDLGLGFPGLPAPVSQLIGTVDPALANLADTVAAPVSGALSPVIAAPAPVPGVTPEEPAKPAEPKTPAPARKQAKGITRKADLRTAATGDIFSGLPASGHAAYGAASVIHLDALQVGQQRLGNVDAAFSGATFASAPIGELKNEMARIVAPALAAGNAFGRGSGLEAGVAMDASGQNQVIPGSVAEAKAPPSTPLLTTEAPDVKADPLASASLLRGQAQAKANSACTTGTDLSYGLGYAADLGLLTAAGLGSPLISSQAPSPDRAVQQSRSHTFLVAQDGTPSPIRKFGLASETRMTIAPITFFAGQAQQFTLEFSGEWVLRAVADGKTGKVFYGPGDVSPETPVLRILDKALKPTNIITTQQLLGPNGLNVNIPNVANITIGGPPRAIGGAATSKATETATQAAGAVDVVQVQLLNTSGAHLADVRIGHMENATQVPAGGIECGIALVKNTDKEVVGPSDSFTWTIKVTNPNDCVLTKLKLVDTITADPGIIWTTESAQPSADQLANGGVTWNDIGPLKPGQSKELAILMSTAPNTGGGRFLDEAVATGVCGPAAGTAGAEAAVGVPLEARVSLNLPEVNIVLAAAQAPRELPRTGGVLAVLPALALTGGGLFLRQAKRRRRAA